MWSVQVRVMNIVLLYASVSKEYIVEDFFFWLMLKGYNFGQKRFLNTLLCMKSSCKRNKVMDRKINGFIYLDIWEKSFMFYTHAAQLFAAKTISLHLTWVFQFSLLLYY